MNRFLFVRNGCDFCKVAKKSVLKVNRDLKFSKRIIIVDCTYHDMYGVGNPLIERFANEIESYPTLIIGDVKKEGANSLIEYYSWLKVKLMNDFETNPGNEFLPAINQYAMFNKVCKMDKGRNICN